MVCLTIDETSEYFGIRPIDLLKHVILDNLPYDYKDDVFHFWSDDLAEFFSSRIDTTVTV